MPLCGQAQRYLFQCNMDFDFPFNVKLDKTQAQRAMGPNRTYSGFYPRTSLTNHPSFLASAKRQLRMSVINGN